MLHNIFVRFPLSSLTALSFLLAALFLAASPGAALADAALPALSLDGLDALLQQRQRPTLVVVMASWCGPCVEELPRINSLYEEYRSQDVAVIGLSLDFNPAAIKRLLTAHRVTFPFYWLGEQGITALNAAKVPLFLLLKKGQNAIRIQGARTDSELRDMFATLAEK